MPGRSASRRLTAAPHPSCALRVSAWCASCSSSISTFHALMQLHGHGECRDAVPNVPYEAVWRERHCDACAAHGAHGRSRGVA